MELGESGLMIFGCAQEGEGQLAPDGEPAQVEDEVDEVNAAK